MVIDEHMEILAAPYIVEEVKKALFWLFQDARHQE